MINSNTHGGLGNRLKNIVSCMKLSEEYNLPINIIWEKKPFVCNCEFNDLFSNDFLVNKSIKSRIEYPFGPFSCWRLYVSDKDDIPNNFTKIKKNCLDQNFSGNINYTRFIDFEYNRISDSLKNQYNNYFNSLKLKKEIKIKIENFSNKHFDDKTISVHFRGICKGDSDYFHKGYEYLLEKWKKEYENEMKKYSTEHKFYFTCVNKSIVDYFKNIFKNRIISYKRKICLEKKNDDRNTIEGIQDDLVELYLLSKNNIIIGSHSSTYTEVAWYLGGCTEKITII